MKREQILSLLVVLLLLAVGTAQSLEASTPSVPDETTLSSCGVANGFASGAMFAATIAALTPGGQTAAAILGITAVSLRLGTSILC